MDELLSEELDKICNICAKEFNEKLRTRFYELSSPQGYTVIIGSCSKILLSLFYHFKDKEGIDIKEQIDLFYTTLLGISGNIPCDEK